MKLQTYTSNSLNVYIYKLDEIVLDFNKTVDSTTKMKQIYLTSNAYL